MAKRLKNINILLLIFSVISLALFIVFTAIVRIETIRSSITFPFIAKLNRYFVERISYNNFYFQLTNIIEYFAILVCSILFIIGIIRLVSNKKIDKNVIYLGLIVIIIFIIHILFNNMIITFSPYYSIPEKHVVSYPTLTLVTGVSLLIVSSIYLSVTIKDKGIRISIKLISYSLSLIMVIARILCGYNLIVDIIGGILLSIFLILLYLLLININDKNETEISL